MCPINGEKYQNGEEKLHMPWNQMRTYENFNILIMT